MPFGTDLLDEDEQTNPVAEFIRTRLAAQAAQGAASGNPGFDPQQAAKMKLAAGLSEDAARIGHAISGASTKFDPSSFQQQQASLDKDLTASRLADRDNQKTTGNAVKDFMLAKYKAKEAGDLEKTREKARYEDRARDRDARLDMAKMATDARRDNNDNLTRFRDDQATEKMDFRAHQTTLNKLRSDKTLADSANRAQNVANALSNADALGKVTAQDFHDLQQLLVSNMGMNGGGSAHERADRYASTLGVKGSELLQFITGTPQDVGKDNPLFDRFKELGGLEVGNFRNRMGVRLKAITSGNDSMYKRRPDLQQDLEDAMAAQYGQIPGGDKEKPPASPFKNLGGKQYRKVQGGWEEVTQ